MTPLVIIALPSLVGVALVALGARATPRGDAGVSGLGTDAVTENLQLTQQYQLSAFTGTVMALGLLMVPVLTAAGAYWMLRKA